MSEERPIDHDATDSPSAAAAPGAHDHTAAAAATESGPAGTREVDVVFICDCTGSMGSYLAEAKRSTTSIVQSIIASEKADVRFALVTYRDHPPQDSTYVTQTFPFTASRREIQTAVDSMEANGGGDGPEAVTPALKAALDLDWRKSAVKVAVLIADAPPHGIEPTGDGFPDGDPSGLDPLQLARDMAKAGITLYSAGCEPAIRHYRNCVEFLIAIADITGGQAITLSSAHQLATLIVAGAREEVQLEHLMNDVQQEVHAEAEAAGIADLGDADEAVQEEWAERIATKMRARGVRTKQLHTDGFMEAPLAAVVKASPSLAAAKVALAREKGLTMNAPPPTSSRAWRAAPVPSLAARASAAIGGALRRRSLGASMAERASMARAPPPPGAPMDMPAAYDGEAEESAMAMPSAYMHSEAAAPAAAASASYVETKEDLVSSRQVRRMVEKSMWRSKA